MDDGAKAVGTNSPHAQMAGNGRPMVRSAVSRSGVLSMVPMLNSGPSEDRGTGPCTTLTHIVEHTAKTGDALVENPEFLNSGMLVGEDPTLNTGSKTPP